MQLRMELRQKMAIMCLGTAVVENVKVHFIGLPKSDIELTARASFTEKVVQKSECYYIKYTGMNINKTLGLKVCIMYIIIQYMLIRHTLCELGGCGSYPSRILPRTLIKVYPSIDKKYFLSAVIKLYTY